MVSLFEEMIDIFEVDVINEADVLREYELWDSLSVISLLAFLDEQFGINIEATELVDVVTVADLLSFVNTRRQK